MKPLFALLAVLIVAFVATAAPAASPEQDYMLNCMGCHQADGFGSPGRVPPLVGIDRFLASPEGRAYLIRVPGVAHAGLSDRRLAALLNWTITRFGRARFRQYTTEEVAPLRKRPFLNAMAARRDIVVGLEQLGQRTRGDGHPLTVVEQDENPDGAIPQPVERRD